MSYFKPIAALAVLGFALVQLFSGGAIKRPPGVLAPDEPLQQLVARPAIRIGEFTLTPRADYSIEARILSVERYRVGTEAKLSPVDFAVGWGVMSDSAVLEHFRMSQGARYFSIHPDASAIELDDAMRHASNMHLIPADGSIERILLAARAGNVAVLKGYLVSVIRADGFTWNSSLSRDDKGPGACELMYVQSIDLR